jgi:hypothetical protein
MKKKERKMQILTLTNHAKQRIQQRGIKQDVVNFIIDQADKVEHSRDGASAISVSKKRIKHLIKKKIVNSHLAEKANGVVLIENNGDVLTVFHKTRSRLKH